MASITKGKDKPRIDPEIAKLPREELRELFWAMVGKAMYCQTGLKSVSDEKPICTYSKLH